MPVDWLTSVFAENSKAEAIIWKDRSYSYGWLLEQMEVWRKRIHGEGVSAGAVAVLEADFSPNSVALFLVLLETGCVLVPLTRAVEARKPELIRIAQGEVSFRISAQDDVEVVWLGNRANHQIFEELRGRNHAGLVLFSSGSTGKSKAAVHDMVGLLEKFKVQRRCLRAITFLLYDHIGGVNTMLYTLSNAGCMVTVEKRDPDRVLHAIEKYQVELLPTSPTFINLILLTGAYERHDLSSLRIVSYGTEPMPESTLRRFHELFPHIRLQQTYGLSELGILRSRSKSSDSLWVKVGGEGFETRIVDGILQIKASSPILGYLNAPNPFTEDGWFVTGDIVIQDGEYIRFLGRESEVINVAGQKVFPAEVESVIQELDNVLDVTVHGERNLILGQIVCARVTLQREEDPKQFVPRLKNLCQERLEPFKIPVRVEIVGDTQYGVRFKRMRRRGG